jgi:hypothetical protein
MKEIILLLGVIFIFGCADKKKEVCVRFDIPKHSEKISKIILLEQGKKIRKILSKKEIDSILLNLRTSCSVFLKFGSKKSMCFYEQDNLVFCIVIGDDYFKYKGRTYKFENKTRTNRICKRNG